MRSSVNKSQTKKQTIKSQASASETNESKLKTNKGESNKKILKYSTNLNRVTTINNNFKSSVCLVNPLKKKIDRIYELREGIKEDYLRSSQRRYVISKWQEVIQILQTLDIKLLLIAIKVLGDIHMEFDDYENARGYFSFYKIVSFKLELFEETMYAYESLGNVYKFLYQYNKAIQCYKKLVELAWILNNKDFELRAYDNIGIQYFYLCNKPKAQYYHDRFIYGLYEKDTKIKEAVLENFKNKHYNLFDDDKQLIIRNYSNEELKDALCRHIKLYEGKDVDLENYDIFKNLEMRKNSYISDIDMTFQVITTKYLENDYLNNANEMRKKLYYEKYKKKKGDISSIDKNDKENLGQSDNLILSHLSTKRKDYSSERFEYIFKRFDHLFERFSGRTKKK